MINTATNQSGVFCLIRSDHFISVNLGQVGVHNNKTAHHPIESSSELVIFSLQNHKEIMINGNSLQTMTNL